jgi:hypothetical protein
MRKGLEAWEFFDGCRWRGEESGEKKELEYVWGIYLLWICFG